MKRAQGLAVAGVTLSLAACSTMTGTLFPEKPPSPVPPSATAALPNAGTSFFTPVPVTPGANTGTPAGQKIVDMRARLVAIQGEISARNASLSEIRQRTAGEGALYRIAKSELATAAQPTPPQYQKAQGALDRLAASTTALDSEMRVFAKGAAEANKLMNESVAVKDATEDEQNQLNTLRGEIGATANQLDRLVNEISNEWALQSAFLAKERAALATLSGAMPATVTTNTGPAATPGSASAALLSQPAFVTIKFDRPNVSYRDALAQAVSAAKRRNPNAAFDVVGVAAGRTVAPEATARAQEVASTLTTLGVDAAKVRLYNAVNSAAQAHEVRIYAR
jgi:hypothetical protein